MLTMKNDMPCFELIALNCEARVSGFLSSPFFTIDNIFANYNFTLTAASVTLDPKRAGEPPDPKRGYRSASHPL